MKWYLHSPDNDLIAILQLHAVNWYIVLVTGKVKDWFTLGRIYVLQKPAQTTVSLYTRRPQNLFHLWHHQIAPPHIFIGTNLVMLTYCVVRAAKFNFIVSLYLLDAVEITSACLRDKCTILSHLGFTTQLEGKWAGTWEWGYEISPSWILLFCLLHGY